MEGLTVEQSFVAAILMQAYKDAMNGKTEHIKEETRAWIDNKNPAFCDFCTDIGIDPDVFRSKALANINHYRRK